MTNFFTLKDQYDTLTQVEVDRALSLHSSLTTSPLINGFLDTVPGKYISLEGVVIVEGNGSVTLTGLVIEKWPVQGLKNGELRDIFLSLIFTGEGGSSPLKTSLDVSGSFFIDGKGVSLTGMLEEDNSLLFSLGNSPCTFSLEEISDAVTNSSLTPSLPPSYLVTPSELFNELTLSSFDLQFGFDSSIGTLLSVYTQEEENKWIVIPGLLELKSIETTVEAQYQPLGASLQPSYSGSVQGLLPIGSDCYQISLAFSGRDFWEIMVIQADGESLPGLYELAQFIGGESLKSAVEGGLKLFGIDDISIDGVRIGFDLSQGTLRYFSMDSHIELFGARINLYTYLPDFNFGGSLDSGSKISLKQFVEDYFGSSLNFPEIDITQYSFSASPNPEKSAYSTSVMIESNWEFKISSETSIALTEVELSIDWASDGENTTINGSLSAMFSIAGVTFFIEAVKEGDDHDGWMFSGSTGQDQNILIGDLIIDLANIFGGVTLPSVISDLVIRNLAVTFNTASKDFTFTCEALFPVGDQEVDMTIDISCLHNEGGSHINTLTAKITIATLIFDLVFAEETFTDPAVNSYEAFIGAFHQEGGTLIPIKSLTEAVSTSLASIIPASLSLTLIDTLFAFYREIDSNKVKQPSKFLFALDVGGGINLSNLPQVGQIFPANQTLAVEELRFLTTSTTFSQEQVGRLNAFIPEGISTLPNRALSSGLSLSANMQFGDSRELLNLSIAQGEQEKEDDNQVASTSATSVEELEPASVSSTSAYWYKLQKSFGPVYFDRVGVKYSDEGGCSTLWFLMDASLSNSSGTTSLSLIELSLGSPLTRFTPLFDLRGIGIEFGSKTLSIGAEFLKVEVEEKGESWIEYQGGAILKTKACSISAIGSYSERGGTPSLFIYAFLDKPLGGPPCFFITGLAAGFGYNRSLRLPTIEEIDSFPLVEEAMNGTGNMDDLTGEMRKLQPYLTPEAGKDFIAFGIKFNSFKIIDSFALFIFIKGDREMIKILGISELVMPPKKGGAPALAVIKMNLEGTIDPEEGLIGIQGQLTSDSYIFSQKCTLLGGFAFFTWVSGKHAGDFVATIGGYHPEFIVPDHYPMVPRLSFDWRISSSISICGEAYFALTAHALMAGGKMDATWNGGGIKASFSIAADFIISWKPYYYDAKISLSIAVSFKIKVKLGFSTIHKTIKLSVGSDLHLWGPEFSGKARVHCSSISFTISFGSASSGKPKAISWDEFKESFLPKHEDVIAFAITDGLIQSVKENKDDDTELEEIWLINGKHLSLSIDSAIPTGKEGKTGIGSMEISPKDFQAPVNVQIYRQEKDGQWVGVDDNFSLSSLTKDVPAGLWGKSITPKVNDESLITAVSTGFIVTPHIREKAGESSKISTEVLGINIDSAPEHFLWEPLSLQAVESMPEEERLKEISKSHLSSALTSNETMAMLQTLGLEPSEINLYEYESGDFLGTPQIEERIEA